MFHDYREALCNAFFERRIRNPSYSLRAFARDIGMASSNLSLVLKKKKGINRSTAVEVSKRLNFSVSEQDLFCKLVEKEHARSKIARFKAEQDIAKKQLLASNLDLDKMRVVGGWFHFAIVELIRTPTIINHAAATFADALEVSESEVESALKILLKTGLIKRNKNKFKVVSQFNWSTDGIPSEVIRKAHDLHLMKSKEALFTQAIDERDFTSMILSIDQSDLPSAKKDLIAFIKNFTDKYSGKSTADRVYSMNMQLFNLSTGLNRGKK